MRISTRFKLGRSQARRGVDLSGGGGRFGGGIFQWGGGIFFRD